MFQEVSEIVVEDGGEVRIQNFSYIFLLCSFQEIIWRFSRAFFSEIVLENFQIFFFLFPQVRFSEDP